MRLEWTPFFCHGDPASDHLSVVGACRGSREVVLCHERVHLQRRDYLIKPAVLFICCVHWFNPLVWLAFYLMNMDCEMSCDEKVVKLWERKARRSILIHCWRKPATAGGENTVVVRSARCYPSERIMKKTGSVMCWIITSLRSGLSVRWR